MADDPSSTHDHDSDKPIGDLLDSLGVTGTVAPDELAAGAIVLLKVIQSDGSTRLTLSSSEGLGWIERIGMLRVAEQLESTTGFAETP